MGSHHEARLTVPAAVLDECQKSFKAADKHRQKASAKLFADTGLMALLCRHDRVLWLVNMVSAGERQHYAVALILQLFKQLPASVTVGVLYDIGCQLHRSCELWDFLGDYLPRVKFGISVFHAFGHQWPCQLLFHPRKCIGFGLTDGEGCERFWSSIKKLIPVLRVSGVGAHPVFTFISDIIPQYHQRLLTLDTQVRHLEAKSLLAFGHWLSRKWQQCQTRKTVAKAELARLGLSKDELREQWAFQLQCQTQPTSRMYSISMRLKVTHDR